jgi:hypothetical protein
LSQTRNFYCLGVNTFPRYPYFCSSSEQEQALSNLSPLERYRCQHRLNRDHVYSPVFIKLQTIPWPLIRYHNEEGGAVAEYWMARSRYSFIATRDSQASTSPFLQNYFQTPGGPVKKGATPAPILVLPGVYRKILIKAFNHVFIGLGIVRTRKLTGTTKKIDFSR